ncbi:MAG: ABC transporter ATP-binding protein [Bdellovibrionales bacterium]|nr:ABC transporter ATP-binding protein [Bdellovibrionales bacterium]
MSILKVRDLEKSYKKGFIPKSQKVLKGVNFTIEAGKITGFLGGNGAGKTTTMKCLLGLAFPDSGIIEYFGGKPLDSEVKKKIGFLPERPYFYDYLTGEEFLKFYGKVSQSVGNKELLYRIDDLLKRVDLEHARHKQLKDYSKGMLQKIGLAQALIHKPSFVILDEPMAGLDPDGRYYLSELINETAKNGTSIFLSSHLLNDVEKLCENLVILNDGKVAYEGTTRDLIKGMSTKVKIFYLVNGEVQSKECAKGSELQKEIDGLRAEGREILSITEKTFSLEKAFIDMAMKAAGKEVSH